MNEKNMPRCVGFIMDGNRRWAKERGQTSLDGHSAGERIFRESVSWIKESGIAHAVYYAFSTENWKRSAEEVSHLMGLFELLLERMQTDIDNTKVRIKVIGRKEDLSEQLQQRIIDLEAISNKYHDTTVWVAISYGGRAELLAAIKEVIQQGGSVDEDRLGSLMWTAGMPDPDLIIRTGGEKRLSNFLPWQSVYSELFFIDTYWPAFTKEEFARILAEYGERNRRLGA